jgi:hypothetical protein
MTHIYALVSGQLILYVGKTGDMKRREYNHRHSSNNCYSKYIPEYIDWTMKLLETVPNDQAVTKEQHYYDTLKPLYNCQRPGQTKRKYQQSEAYKEYRKIYEQSEARKEAQKKYQQSEAYKESQKKYRQSEVYKKAHKEIQRKYRLKKKSETPVADVI